MTSIQIFKRLYRDYTKKYVPKIFLSVFFSLLLAASTSAIAYLLDPAINELFIKQSSTLIFTIPLLIIAAFAIKGISLYLAKVIMIGVAEEVKKEIQTDMFASLIKADTKLIDEKHSGKFITNLINDVNWITSLLSTAILNFFKDSLTLIGLLSVMFYQNWKLSLIAIIMIPLASLAAKSLGKRIGKVTNEQMLKVGVLNTYLMEIFKNHKLMKIFQKETYEKERALKYINTLKETSKKINIVFVRASPIMEVLTGIMIACLIFVSAKLVVKNELEVSNFFSFLAAMMLAYQPVRSLATLNITIQQGLTGSRRVLPIIDDVNEIKDESNAEELNLTEGEVKFENVSFDYQKDQLQIIKAINLQIPGKKMTSLVGHSGAGKSTILNLIPRFYNIHSGDIKIDNQSIYKSTISSVRKNISLVSQDTLLFDDTIKNNIAYAKDNASMDEILRACKFAAAEEFIDKMPKKYNTLIGENGIRLSGGQKQRLSIARAVLKESPIILLDEATANVDSLTERDIQQATQTLLAQKTAIVVAHRLSTIQQADIILALNEGKIIEYGTHKSLLKQNGFYARGWCGRDHGS